MQLGNHTEPVPPKCPVLRKGIGLRHWGRPLYTRRQPVEASRRYSFFILLELQPTPFIYPPTLFRFGIRVQWFAAKKGLSLIHI